VNSDNPFADPAPLVPRQGTLSAEEQAEYDRLEALEADDHEDRGDDLLDSDRDAEAIFPLDPDAEANYPVQNAAVKWDDASNGGDTSREAKHTYDTQWGRRELSAAEVVDFGHQGVVVTRVDAEPETSLQREKDELSAIDLSFRPES
jgi:hypothetical protein